MKKEEIESPEEDAAPTEEQPEGTENTNESAGAGIKLPEAFQQSVHDIISQCTNNAQVDYIMSCAGDKRMELSKSIEKKPAEFSEEDMPA